MTENTSTTKLFVGGLPWKIRWAELRELFSQFGDIVFASVKLDRETRRSRGFGFVEFENAEDASKAQSAMDGSELEGRTLKVDFAIERPESERFHKEEAGNVDNNPDETGNSDEAPAEEEAGDE